jgi:galactosylceramidase
MDQGGAFEVAPRTDEKGNCLRQLITRKTIEWEDKPMFNQTVIGDAEWTDYTVSSDVLFPEPYCYANVFVRATEMYRSHQLPDAYILKLQSSGKWELMAGSKILASGFVPLILTDWQTIQLQVKGDLIKAWINQKELVSMNDKTYKKGLAGFGCSFHRVDFDNFSIK